MFQITVRHFYKLNRCISLALLSREFIPLGEIRTWCEENLTVAVFVGAGSFEARYKVEDHDRFFALMIGHFLSYVKRKLWTKDLPQNIGIRSSESTVNMISAVGYQSSFRCAYVPVRYPKAKLRCHNFLPKSFLRTHLALFKTQNS